VPERRPPVNRHAGRVDAVESAEAIVHQRKRI
jgi:hypothetical protein